MSSLVEVILSSYRWVFREPALQCLSGGERRVQLRGAAALTGVVMAALLVPSGQCPHYLSCHFNSIGYHLTGKWVYGQQWLIDWLYYTLLPCKDDKGPLDLLRKTNDTRHTILFFFCDLLQE